MSRTTTTVEYPIRLILTYTWFDGNRNGLQIIYERGDSKAAREFVCNLNQIRFIDDGPSVIVFDNIEETWEEGVFRKKQVTKKWSDVREIRIRRDFQTQTK